MHKLSQTMGFLLQIKYHLFNINLWYRMNMKMKLRLLQMLHFEVCRYIFLDSSIFSKLSHLHIFFNFKSVKSKIFKALGFLRWFKIAQGKVKNLKIHIR